MRIAVMKKGKEGRGIAAVSSPRGILTTHTHTRDPLIDNGCGNTVIWEGALYEGNQRAMTL